MRGADAIVAARLAGTVVRAVHAHLCGTKFRPVFAARPDRLPLDYVARIGRSVVADLWIEPADNVDTLDLRLVHGLQVIVTADADQRGRSFDLASRLMAFSPKHVLATTADGVVFLWSHDGLTEMGE